MMLSHLLGIRLVSDGAPCGRLSDLVVDLESGDEPVVTGLIAKVRGGGEQRIPWTSVRQLDLGGKQLLLSSKVEPGAADRSDTLSESGCEVRLRSDVLDAAIIDIPGRGTYVANDLWLEERDGRLYLAAVDTSPWGIVRRLSRGIIDREPGDARHPWVAVDYLRGVPESANEGVQHQRLTQLPQGEIAHLLQPLSYLHATELIAQLDDQQAAGILQALSPERQLQVFEELDEEQAIHILRSMAPDDAADLIGELPPDRVRYFLGKLPETRRNQLLTLLRYPLDSAGGIMTNDLIVFPRSLTVGEAREQLRGLSAMPELIYFIYIIDDFENCQLCGVVTLREIVRAGDDRRMEELMETHLVTIDPLEPAQEAAYRVVDNQLIALPVVSQTGRLVGAITVDAAVRRVAPMSWRRHAPRVFS